MGNELKDETLGDIIAEKRRSAEHIWNNLSTVPVRQWDQEAEIKSLEDEADRLDRARMKMENEMANLRNENAKLREAVEQIRDMIMYGGFVGISSASIVNICDAALATEKEGGNNAD